MEKLLSAIFFFFFIAQIFSPYFMGRTIYLEGVLPFLNPYFWVWISKFQIKKIVLPPIFFLCAFILILHPDLLIKMILMASVVLFLGYAYERGVFYLYQFVFLSICFAVCQFILVFIDPVLARSIGPTALSSYVWGQYATPTFSNFFTVFYFPRVSGLSREAGFFASFLVSVFVVLLADRSLRSRSRWVGMFVGFVLSLSKVSIVVIPMLIFVKLKRVIDQIPMLVTFLITFTALYFVGGLILDSPASRGSISMIHRFGGFALINELTFSQLLFGVSDVRSLPSDTIAALGGDFTEMAGLGGFLVSYGLLLSFLWLAIIYVLGVRSSGLLVIIFLSIAVSPMTNQNFVVLAYFSAMFLLPNYLGKRP